MITKRILMVVVLSAAALVLTSLFVTAPASASELQPARVYDDNPPDSVLTDTLPTTHPVGIVIALYFNIPYTQVIALHDGGFGFGNIARAYLTAYGSGGVLTPTQVLQLRLAGVGWGQIKKEYGVHPGGNGLGSIMRNKGATPVPTAEGAPPQIGPGKGGSGGSGGPGGSGGSGGSNCPGNSCNAPGHQNSPNSKPPKGPKK